MDALEQLVREALAEHAHEAPAALTVPDPPAGRRWPYAVLAAAVVAALAIGIVIGRGGGSHSAEPAAPTFAPIPAGMNEISYHGITLQVPNTMFLDQDGCGPAVNEVFAPDPLLEARTFPCVRSPTFAGHPRTVVILTVLIGTATRYDLPPLPIHSTRDVHEAGVRVAVYGDSRAQVDAIIGSVRSTPVDRNGCAARLPALRDAPNGMLVPGTPLRATECSYTRRLGTHERPWLVRSLPIDADRTARLEAAINALPAGSSSYPDSSDGSVRYLFTYANGNTRTIDVTRGGDPTVTDGQHVAHDPHNAIANAFD